METGIEMFERYGLSKVKRIAQEEKKDRILFTMHLSSQKTATISSLSMMVRALS